MSNGAAAVALAFPPPAPTKSPADAPAASQEIGEAVAAAAVAVSQAIDGYRSQRRVGPRRQGRHRQPGRQRCLVATRLRVRRCRFCRFRTRCRQARVSSVSHRWS